MIKRMIVIVVLGFSLVSTGFAAKREKPAPAAATPPKVTREFLLAHGFKQSATDRDFYELKDVRLADVCRHLGFPLVALERMPNGSDLGPDVRDVPLHGVYFVVRSKEHLKLNSRYKPLDDPNAVCTVSYALYQVRGPEHLKTDSTPRVRITSVTVPRDPEKGMQVSFELAADGKTPLSVGQNEILVGFARGGQSPRDFPRLPESFPPGTPSRIRVSSRKPTVLTITTFSNTCPRTGGSWSDLPAGQYLLCVGIASADPEGPRFDYHWEGITISDDYKLVIK